MLKEYCKKSALSCVLPRLDISAFGFRCSEKAVVLNHQVCMICVITQWLVYPLHPAQSATGRPLIYHPVAVTSFGPLIDSATILDTPTDSTGSLTQQWQQEDQSHPQIPKLKCQSIGFDGPQQQTPSGDGASQSETECSHHHC